MKKRVLLVINTSTYFSVLIYIARLLRQSGQYTPIFFFSQSYPTLAAQERICRKEGIRFFKRSSEKSPRRSKIAAGKAALAALLRKLFFIELPVILSAYKKEISYIAHILKRLDPSLIILAGDLAGYNTSIFVKLGHKMGIPSAIFPQWMAGPKESAEYVFNNPAYSMGKITNRLVGRLYPKWLYTHRGRRLLRLPAAEVLAIEWFGLAPKKPWVLHSAPSDVIALESEAIRAYCQKEGLPSSRLKVVGSIHNDILFAGLMKKRRLRLALCHKLGFDARKPIILSALPPDFLYATGGRSECDFTDYRKLVEFWVKTLVGNATRQVVISLHPSVKISDFKYIERWGVKISDQSIIELIPLCDIFVASISATIQWAIACGKPVINYDVYKYRYGDYDKTPGTITIEGKADFGKYLNKFIRDKKYLQRMTKRQAAVAAEWGRLDGKSGERILQLIDKLTIGADGR